MSATAQGRVAAETVALLDRRNVRHTIVWVAFFFLLLLIDDKTLGLGYAIIEQLIVLVFYILIVYININYLIPNYLSQKSILTYTGLLLLASMILTPIKTLALYFLYNQEPMHQEYLTFHWHDIFLSILFVGVLSTLAKILGDWLKHERDRQDLETQTMQSELKFLKSQINPHFLFNTLNSLYALTLKKSDNAPEIVIKLSEMMRYMLYECNERRVPLRKEVQYIRNYLDLESLRQGHNVEITFEVSGEIDDQQIAPLMFTPFLENSFKHGLNNQIAEGFVRIKLDVEEKRVHLLIENSKPPTRPVKNPAKPSGGIGLVNVRRRLDLIYPDQYELHMKDEPDKYRVTLDLNLDN